MYTKSLYNKQQIHYYLKIQFSRTKKGENVFFNLMSLSICVCHCLTEKDSRWWFMMQSRNSPPL